jgi:hypothetical protein
MALFCDPNLLRPLPKALQGIACAACDKRQAVWEHTQDVRDRRGEFVCSLCWLYHSAWTPGTEEELAKLIAAVEEQMKTTFEKNARGELLSCKDGDRILGSIVMTSRLSIVRGKVKLWDTTG